MPTLCKKYRQTNNISLVRIFSELDLYWFYVNVSNSLTHCYLSGTVVLGSAWLHLSSSHSAYELEIKYSVKACCECFFCAYFMSASTRTWWWMLKILVLNNWTPEHVTYDCDVALNLYHIAAIKTLCNLFNQSYRVHIIIHHTTSYLKSRRWTHTHTYTHIQNIHTHTNIHTCIPMISSESILRNSPAHAWLKNI